MSRKVEFTKREIGESFSKTKILLVIMGAVLVLSLTGPFGTYDDLSIIKRFAYWALVINGVGIFMRIFVPAMLNHHRLKNIHPFLNVLGSTAIAAIPGTIVVVVIEEIFRPQHTVINHTSTVWAQVWMISALISIVEFITWRLAPNEQEAEPKTEIEISSDIPHSPFLDRIPNHLGSDIISLSMKDHYVEVVTSRGSDLVLLRLSDAIKELVGIAGTQTHRSHWVSKSHVKALSKKYGRNNIELSDGRSLPVSATYLKQVSTLLEE